jgi:hypothetical protein
MMVENHLLESMLQGVELSQLRQTCGNGIPDEPVQLRPTLWSMLLELVPSKGDREQKEAESRHMYYVRPSRFR